MRNQRNHLIVNSDRIRSVKMRTTETSWKLLAKLVGLIVLLAPMNLLGGWSSTAGTVRNIYSHSGTVLIDTEISDGPCGEGKGFWWPITDDDSQVMTTLVLTAMTTGKRIKVVYSPENPQCLYNRAKITHLLLLGT